MKTKLNLEYKGSLIMVAGTNTTLGYLVLHEGAAFDAHFGKVEVSPDEAKTHNELLSEAELKGLDENCQVGQQGTFFFDRNKQSVTTWLGTPVTETVHYVPGGKVVTFTRKGKTFKGFLRKEADCFNFKRVT